MDTARAALARVPFRVPLVVLALVPVLLASARPARATDVCGTIAVNTTWNLAGSPYVATCDVVVASGATLTIDAGVTVRFRTGTRLRTLGRLDANGTTTQPLRFTSDLATPARGDWFGVEIDGTAQAVLHKATVEWAQYDLVAREATTVTVDGGTYARAQNDGLYAEGHAVVSVSGATLTENGRYGLQVYSYGSGATGVSLTATGCTVTANTSHGVYLHRYYGPDPAVGITGSSIHSNAGAYDLSTSAFAGGPEAVVTATGNWWGTADGAAIAARIYDNSDSDSRPIVDRCGYLAAAGGAVVHDGYCPDPVVCNETVTWTQTDRPYFLEQNVAVCPTGTLRVNAGVTARALGGAATRIAVRGVLDVNGTAGQPVRLSSSTAVPARGDWYGLSATGSASLALDHTTVEWAQYGVVLDNATSLAMTGGALSRHQYDGLYAGETASATLANVSVTDNARYGVYVYSFGSGSARVSLTATGCAFTGNTNYGVYLHRYYGPDPAVSLTGSAIHSNAAAYDLYTGAFASGAQTIVTATGNWWGTADGAAIAARIYDNSDSDSRPIVDRCGFLAAAGGAPVHDGYCPDPVVCDETVTWNKTDKPYFLEQNVAVCPTGTLVVNAGVTAKALGGAATRIVVRGTLDVNGTVGQPVRLTSATAAPARGDWYGVSLVGTAVATLDQATIEWAQYGVLVDNTSSLAMAGGSLSRHLYDGLYAGEAATATLANVSLAENGRYGAYVYSYGSGSSRVTLTATGSAFTGNTGYGLYLHRYYGPDPAVSVTGSSIHSNAAAYDLYTGSFGNVAETLVDARGNWWGTADGAVIAARIYDSSDADGRPIVDRCGYLAAAGGAPVHDGYCPDPVVCNETVTWDRTDKPYFIEQNIAICASGTLRVDAGVRAKALGGAATRIAVRGTLDVNGTVAQPVLLSSATAAPARGDWYGIGALDAGAVALDHATVEWAQYGVVLNNQSTLAMTGGALARHQYDGLYAGEASTATLAGASLQENGRYGVYVYSYGSGSSRVSLTATGCTVTLNTNYGVYLYRYYGPDPAVTINASSLLGNGGGYDLYTNSFGSGPETVVNARGNWWGSADTTAVASRIYDISDAGSRPVVDRCGFLAAAGGLAAHDGHCPDAAVRGTTVTWDRTDKPYYVEQVVFVATTGTVIVAPGVELRAAGGSATWIDVRGAFETQGTRRNPVRVTSSATTPVRGDWDGFRVVGGTATLRGALVEWGRWAVNAGETGTVRLEDATLARSLNDGLYVSGTASATLVGTTLTENGRHGMYAYAYGSGVPLTVRATGGSRFVANTGAGAYVQRYYGPNPDVVITGSVLRGNAGSHDLETRTFDTAGSPILWAPDNWWGTSDPVVAKQRIYDRDETTSAPTVYIRPFGRLCDPTLGRDGDLDGRGDVEDNCPAHANADQADADGDGMGNACDPAPGSAPLAACDGWGDVTDGWIDGDGDGWGNACDRQPTRGDAHPGAPEICDARDDDADGTLATGELADNDRDQGVACGDCNEDDTTYHACVCENCSDLVDNDCDGSIDVADAQCTADPTCVVLTGAEPRLTVTHGACGGATLAGPYDVLRGNIGELAFASGSVDLGRVACVSNDLGWDRVTDDSAKPQPSCDPVPGLFYLARPAGAADYGEAATGEPRDRMSGSPCP